VSPPRTARFSRRHAALVFAVALLPRVVHWAFVRHSPLASDFVPDLAPYLLAVERLMQSAYFFAEPMVMSPGYAFFLAPQYILVGPDIPLFILVNAVFDAGSAALCAGLAARMAPAQSRRLAGLAAGALYVCCGALLFYNLLPLGEGPAVFCLLAGLTLLFDSPRRPAWAAWFAGALLALAGLIRPNLAPAALLALGVWTAFPRGERRTRAQAALRCLLGFALVLAPFMAHNAKVSGRASPFGFQGGFTLYSGNHPGGSGVGDALPGFGNVPYLVILEAWKQAEDASGRELTLAEADGYWYGETWRFAVGNPAEAAALFGRKLLLLVNNDGLDATANMGFCERFSPVPTFLPLPVGFVFALASAGVWLALRRGSAAPLAAPADRSEVLALAAALAAAAALVLVFQVTPRYRVVLLPLAMPFAGVALADWRALLKAPRRGRAVAEALPLALAAGVLAASCIPLRLLVDKPGVEAQEHARLARYYLLRGPQELARMEFREAIRLGAPDRKSLEAGLAASLLLEGGERRAGREPPALAGRPRARY
jgi:hypothetical protein